MYFDGLGLSICPGASHWSPASFSPINLQKKKWIPIRYRTHLIVQSKTIYVLAPPSTLYLLAHNIKLDPSRIYLFSGQFRPDQTRLTLWNDIFSLRRNTNNMITAVRCRWTFCGTNKDCLERIPLSLSLFIVTTSVPQVIADQQNILSALFFRTFELDIKIYRILGVKSILSYSIEFTARGE